MSAWPTFYVLVTVIWSTVLEIWPPKPVHLNSATPYRPSTQHTAL